MLTKLANALLVIWLTFYLRSLRLLKEHWRGRFQESYIFISNSLLLMLLNLKNISNYLQSKIREMWSQNHFKKSKLFF